MNVKPSNAVNFAEQVRLNQGRLASQLKPYYDFIVCGAGTSGSVVAGRLAALFRSHTLYIARIAGPSKTAARPFPLEGKLLGCFCEVDFSVFSSWPSTWTVLGDTAVHSEIYRRFTGGFARNRGLLGHSVRTVRSMQNLQMPCPAWFSAKSLIWRVGT